jgi:hypothetical protein
VLADSASYPMVTTYNMDWSFGSYRTVQRMVITTPTVIAGVEIALDVSAWAAGTPIYPNIVMTYMGPGGDVMSYNFNNDNPTVLVKPTADLQGPFRPVAAFTATPGDWWISVFHWTIVRGSNAYEAKMPSGSVERRAWLS